ncbi:MAG TPA: MSMEG_0570 family nitrogen starvation response protein [Leptolyngbya sp.]|jgi:uncharacterized repeat protein (TIGR04042 family)|nr:MSMEG_0570 family nitrogen starvation response protein [Leptolyngbya sp.]
MPEVRFQIRWSDGTQDSCYSPSLIVKEYFSPNTHYGLEDFVQRSRIALNIASDRVKAKYGRPCGLALGQLQEIEEKSKRYAHLPEATVEVISFLE